MRSGVYITCCMLLLSGCAHGNWRQSVAHGLSREGVQTGSRERVAMVEKLLDDAPVPPRAAVPLLRAQSQDNPGVSLTSSSAEKTAAVSHDATTLALIERETRDFSPEDRDRAVATLKAIPSESIPAVLQLWKAGLISPLAQPTSPVILAPATASDLPSAASLATREITRADSGLGQKSPWQSSSLHQADYVPQESGGQDPANNGGGDSSDSESMRSGAIQRISASASGYSSPFADQSSPRRLADEDMVNGPSVAMSTTTPRGTGSRTSAYSPNDGSQIVPPDWHFRNGNQAHDLSPNGRTVDSFSSDTGRPLVMPGNWQSHLTPQSPAGTVPPPVNFNSYPPTAGTALPDYSDGPVIRPLPRAATSDQAPMGKPSIQRLGFSKPDAERDSGQIGLVPGQLLPGFEDGSVVSQLVTPPRTPSPVALRNLERSQPVATRPPADQPMQTPGDALSSLIRTTEAEVGRLVPGATAEELQYYIERQVYLRLLYLMSGQAESALRPIPNVPAADQEFWTQVLWGVHNYFDLSHIPDHAERAAQTISQFNTAMLRLKERAPLELKQVSFCHQIDGYGEYETYPKDEFTPGQRVLVYAEIGNFHSELSAAGIYRTRLKSTLQVVSAEAPQEPVDVKTYPVTEDYCRNHRRDYFHSYVVEIPVRCVRGAHVLKLIIEDELSGKVATYPIPFVVR